MVSSNQWKYSALWTLVQCRLLFKKQIPLANLNIKYDRTIIRSSLNKDNQEKNVEHDCENKIYWHMSCLQLLIIESSILN